MKISVVFPVYNKEQYLEQSIGSALSQSHPDLEVIAVNDGSTDASLARLESLAEQHPSLIIHSQENRGLSGARNAGLEIATGDYVMFHDADDTIEPGAIAHLAKLAQETGSDVVGGISKRRAGSKEWSMTRFQFNDQRMDFRADQQKALRYCTNFSTCNKIYKRDFLNGNDLRFTPGLYMQDIEFWLKAMMLSRNVTQTEREISVYHYYPDGASRARTPARFESLFTLFDNLTKFAAERGLPELPALRNLAVMQGALMFFTRWKLEEFRQSRRPEDLERIKSLLVQIPEKDLLRFFLSVNRNQNAPVFLLVRSGHFDAAYQADQAFQKGISAASRLAKRALRTLPGRTVNTRSLLYLARGAGSTRGPFVLMAKVVESPFGAVMNTATATIVRLRNLTSTSAVRLRVYGMRLTAPVRTAITRNRKNEPHILVFGLGNLYSIGGVQLSYKHLFEYLCGKGFKITFFTHHERPSDAGAKLYYEFPEQVTIVHYGLHDSRSAKQQIHYVTQSHDPSAVLIVNSGQPALILASALYDLDVPVVYSERGGSDHCLEHNWCSKLQREIVHFASDFAHVLMPSYVKGAPDWLRDYVHVIPSLTEPAERLATPDQPSDGRFKIVYTGRLSFEKDMDKLLHAFSRLAARFEQWDVEIHGDGPERESLEALAQSLGISDRVIFKGNSSDYAAMTDAYCRSHVFALPSRAEGCPLSLREAMAHGLPVIGFEDCSGTNDIIKHGRNGLLAAATDKVATLSDALEQLMADGAKRRSMGLAGVEDVKEYAPEKTLQAWEDLLRRAMACKGRRSELRAEKEQRNPTDYAWKMRVFEASRKQRVTRNIMAYDTGIRRGDFDADDVGAYFMLLGSCLFDPALYAKQNLPLKLAGVDPLHHYIREGWRTANVSDELFDQNWYVHQQMGGDAKSCPLAHYYLYGRHIDPRPSANPKISLMRKIERELKADGKFDVDFSRIPTGEVVDLLMESLTWKRLDFKSLSERYPSLAEDAPRALRAVAS